MLFVYFLNNFVFECIHIYTYAHTHTYMYTYFFFVLFLFYFFIFFISLFIFFIVKIFQVSCVCSVNPIMDVCVDEDNIETM